MTRVPTIVVLTLLALAACTPSHEWTKPGVGQDALMSDLSECRFQAGTRADNEYAAQIQLMEARTNMSTEAGRRFEYQTALENERMARTARTNEIAAECMERRGYVLAPVPPR